MTIISEKRIFVNELVFISYVCELGTENPETGVATYQMARQGRILEYPEMQILANRPHLR